MKRAGSALCAALALAACSEPEQCVNNSSPYYDAGLSKILMARKVPHTVERERGICFAKEEAGKVALAQRDLDRTYYEVADLVRNPCDEEALVAWATREKLPFALHDTNGPDGQPSGKRMINIYSFSSEEVFLNRQKLREAPRMQACATGK